MRKETKSVWMILGIAVLFLMFFSGSTSPLFPYDYGWDSALFILVGKCLNQGKMLYMDIFDHKGPIIFWIEALGDKLHGTYGIFAVQVLFMCLTLNLMRCIFKRVLDKKVQLYEFIIFLIFLSYPFANGNLTEEYSLVFILVPLYLAIKRIMQNEMPSEKDFLVYGICFGILSFIRLNNAVTIAGIVLFWMIYLLKQRSYKRLTLSLAAGAAGIGIVTVPIILYFGQLGTLGDMLYATFGYNFEYGGNGLKSQLTQLGNPGYLLRQGILYFPLIISGWIYKKYVENKNLKELLVLILLINAISLLYGRGYNHYFMIAVPLTGIAAALWLREHKKGNICNRILQCACILAFVGYLFLSLRIVGVNIYKNYIDQTYREQCTQIEENFSHIPEGEKRSIIGYNIHSRCYLMGNVLPAYKYYTSQDSWANSNPQILEDFYQYLEQERPMWIVTEVSEGRTRIKEFLEERYELKMEDDFCRYYRIINR